ncbi:MAG: TIGR01777 family protein [Cytophagales bacterium]|nr:TIGR01777 family protein [Cytophagales bacterium]MCA6366873.1 TIGR01777 family protein [Cytophagales bacterium]MCA6370929.1 TIGR01777 family protein [Cytophagales bacterium]MCA6375346.1 TIGR01777 family protein [Cytophagales bacterium]MCA6382047.1 TIGR01777 family protein [Cytophagales bacterium]
MIQKILVTGASGLVGSRLTEMLLEKGHHVSHLGRSKKTGSIPSFVWNVENKFIDLQALEGVDTIIHLAGAGIADQRWTAQRKKEILESRTHSTQLLVDTLKNQRHAVKTFVGASAIGYYGFGQGEEVFTEESKAGSGFLADVTREWEEQTDTIATLGLRLVKLRIGIVLSEKGGALAEMAKPIRFGVGAPLGSGKQYLSWTHIDDLCAMFIRAAEDQSLQGVYNGVGTNWVTNAELTKAIAHILNRPFWLPNIPTFVMNLILGEMAGMVLNGSKVSSAKIQKAGFQFKYLKLNEALKSLLKA